MKNIRKDFRINPTKQNIKDKHDYYSVFPGVSQTEPLHAVQSHWG